MSLMLLAAALAVASIADELTFVAAIVLAVVILV